MANIRTLKLNLLADVSNFNKELGGVQGKLKGFQNSIKKAGQVATVALGGLAAAGFTAVRAAEEVATANARLDTILTSMGYPEATKRVTDYAKTLEATTAVDENVIKLTQAKLATFKELTATINVAGGAFDRATKAALDMAASGFGDAASNAVQLGKALNDPIKGITALTRSGITFTTEEKKLIETMVKSGDVLGAQEMILKAIEVQVGGTAEATANSSDKMGIAFKNVQEAIGLALLPAFEKLSTIVLENTPKLEQHAGTFLKVGAAILVLAVAVKTLQVGLAAISIIIRTVTLLTAAFNFVLALNPVGLVVLGIVALVAILVIAYNKFEPFKDLVNDVFEVMKKLGSFIKDVFIGYFELWLNIINKVRDAIQGLVNAIGNSSIGRALGGIINRVTGTRAAGGSVSAGQSYRVGEFGSEIFTPNSSGVIRRDNGGGGNTFILNGIVDAQSARRTIEKLLQDSARRTGAVSLVGATL